MDDNDGRYRMGVIAIRLTKEQANWCETCAEEKGMLHHNAGKVQGNRSEYIRHLIDQDMEEQTAGVEVPDPIMEG